MRARWSDLRWRNWAATGLLLTLGVGGFAPIPARSANEIAARLPAPAVADLLEWGTAPSAADRRAAHPLETCTI